MKTKESEQKANPLTDNVKITTLARENEVRAAFTPGPWFVETEQTADGSNLLVIDKENWRTVADCDGGTMGQHSVEQAEANARLIAAAPELYEALGALVDNDYVRHEDMERARAALAKARP